MFCERSTLIVGILAESSQRVRKFWAVPEGQQLRAGMVPLGIRRVINGDPRPFLVVQRLLTGVIELTVVENQPGHAVVPAYHLETQFSMGAGQFW